MRRSRAASSSMQLPRRGAAMVFVMILLLVVSMIGASVVRAAIAQHRQRLRDEIRAQTVRIAEAGWQRAMLRRAADPDYAGEVWRIESAAFVPDRVAEVRVEITHSDADPAGRRLTVTADYPIDDPLRTRFTLDGALIVAED